ncbi:IscS subfamily cysteine desulfurase [Bacillus shivajii]|uniref:IscS subfamily cysteine desulfurase n=1 Tax=Bacillus shivajii TaxID=1983719 RepID=UPI001CF9C341|nr:IscS subfamily cysteine desulfurase [Bacillus shivajii]UCZ54277.1 IscS subfamily cysteine desulfurase [Bacillus shivajii]
MIYLDHAATTPMSKKAMDTYIKANEDFFANTSSLHEAGEKSSMLVKRCRESLANLLHAKPSEIFFTSGGTESNQRLLKTLYYTNKHKGNHVITTRVEHPSVHSYFQILEEQGVEVTYLNVDQYGQISLEELKGAIRPDTILASIQHINSEIGTIQPLEKIGQLLNEHDILFHSDCVQSFGKVPIDVNKLHLDALSISSHKIYGPKGVGAVFLREEVKWNSVDPLTTHENGFRPGTVNTPGIAAFVAASIDMNERMSENEAYIKNLRSLLLEELSPLGELIQIEGHTKEQSPYIIGLNIYGLEGQYIMLTLDRYNICISTGSACQVGKQTPSETMQALKKTDQEARRFFRISLGIHNTKGDIIKTAKIIRTCWEQKEGINHV